MKKTVPTLRVITWNCNMAFRKKAKVILAHKPDILVIQECEHPDKLVFGRGMKKPTSRLWFGANPHKGIGIFSYGDYQLELLDTHNPALKLIIPIAVRGGAFDFTLYAIWANHPTDPDGQYVEQVWKALQHYDGHINSRQTMLAGDFNSNTIWDRKSRIGNHSDVVNLLAEKGIHSSYHLHHKQVQGREKHPTLYLYRHKDKPYHLDYCFISSDLAGLLQSVKIGRHAHWTQFSDHTPVIVTFQLA